MCGIAGIVEPAALTGDPGSILERMTSAIRHRGPDEYGYFVRPGVALGHRRLSIVDLATGQQPMCNEDERLWVVYNGEIFNHADLRPSLEQKGHRYRTRCDTETILHAYEEYGADCVLHFRGMFAFALWDGIRRQLFCVRDRLGIKPFYYYWDGRLFVFGSEIKALLEHPAVRAELDTEVLPEYLNFGFLSEERTLFRGIRRLLPGHRLTVRQTAAGGLDLAIEPYWDVPVPDREESARSESEWVAELRKRLEETVHMRLMSDVPLGVFLSGGVDSSAIAALVRRATSGPVKTFSVGYAEKQYSELGYAEEVARRIGTEHHQIEIGREEFFDALPALIWHEDEPIAWPSSVSLYFVSKLAASQVKVVLTGEGSDELFAGYERYRWTLLNLQMNKVYRWVPESLRAFIRSQVASTPLLNADLRRKIGHTVVGRAATIESLYLDNFHSAFSLSGQARLLPNASAEQVYGTFMRHWNRHPEATLLRRMLYADQKTYLAELLMKQDQMSMAASIESRVPFLDHTFVEFAMRLPDQLKSRRGVQKYVLKKAVEDLLPHEIIYRPKMGFPTPLKDWLRRPESASLLAGLSDRDGFLAQYLNVSEIQTLVQRNQEGSEDTTDRLWRLLNLQVWGDIYLTGRRERWMDGARSLTS